MTEHENTEHENTREARAHAPGSRKRRSPARQAQRQAQRQAKPPAHEVEVSRAHPLAVAIALDLAGGDQRRLAAHLEPDGSVSVEVLNRPRAGHGQGRG